MHQGNIDSSTTTLNDTGQRRDDTGLLYYNARYYDPRLGRFLSPDSIVPNPQDPQDLNRYTYAKNNPLRYTDPTGHCAILCTALVGAAIGGGIAYGTQVAANISQNGLNVQALTNVDGGEIVAGAVAGGVAGATGFVGGAMLGSGTITTVTSGAVTGVVSGQVTRATENVVAGRPVTDGLGQINDMATDAFIGGITAGVGRQIAATFGPTGQFYSIPNKSGGSVWVSNRSVKQSDFAHIVDNATDSVHILTGTHGSISGRIKPKFVYGDKGFYNDDVARWGQNPRVRISNIHTMNKSQVQQAVNSSDTVICAWCHSGRTRSVTRNIDRMR